MASLDVLPDHPMKSRYKISMLLLDGFNSLAMQAFVDPFRLANYLRAGNLYERDFLSLDEDTVTASNGLNVGGLIGIDQAGKKYDLLVVNASWSPERFKEARLLNWLRGMSVKGSTLCSLDTGRKELHVSINS